MNHSNINVISERDVPGLKKATNTEHRKHKKKKLKKTTYNYKYAFPSIRLRYVSSLIDACLMCVLALTIVYIYEEIGNVSNVTRGITVFIILLLYEPLFVAFGCTFGQLITNIRVRRFYNPDARIGLRFALLRWVIKLSLGWISFITITLNKNRKGIHDIASSSVVISKEGI